MANENTEILSYAEACNKANDQIGEACKILSREPALMQFFEMISLTPVDDKDLQMRLNTHDGGASVFLEYSPYWMNRITDPSILAYFFGAEVLRIALHHATSRRQRPAQSSFLASNLLCFENTSLLSVWREDTKKMLSTIPTWQQVQPMLTPLGFSKENDWFFEKIKCYLDKVIQQQREDNQSNGGSGKNDSSDGDNQSKDQNTGKDNENQQSQQSGDDKGNSGNDKSNGKDSNEQQHGGGDGEDDGENDKDCRPTQGDGSASDCAKACQEYFDNSESHARQQTAKWGENSMVAEEAANIARYIQKNPEMWGHMPGSLQDAIIAANRGKFDPTRIVRHFKQEVQSELFEQSRSKINRRNEDLSGWRHKMKCSMGFFTDTSGSMSDRDVAMGKAFMLNFIKHVQLYAADWDTFCSEIEEIKHDPTKRNGGKIEVTGRGGTNPECIIEQIKDQRLKLGGLVVFTDCGFDWPCPPSKFRNKIFIIGTDDRQCNPPAWCKYYLNIADIRKWYENNK